MPFPPGVGGGRIVGDANLDTFEVITADKAIDENNVGNRMLRNMGWQEGLVPFCSSSLHEFLRITFFCYSSCLVELDILFQISSFQGYASTLILDLDNIFL